MPRKGVIAIVDDDRYVREALKSLVRSFGYVAMTFECAEDRMARMTGLEPYNRLGASGEPIPTILIITAFPNERSRERALQAGVTCYLTKPFSEDDLLACIRSGRGEGGAQGSRRL